MSEVVKFENYELLRREDGSVFELGRGAMGVTYKAWDADLHCHVALKVINPAFLSDPQASERFLREARAAAQLRHPNIATIYRLGRTQDETYFYAMEFCDGPTLEKALSEWSSLPGVKALGIAWQVAKALILAEEHRLLHRDLKPSNLILTERTDEGTVVKVIDFGLAKSLADGSQSLATLGSSSFVGTAHFASPEQLEEQNLDIRSDIYSLGVCVWFMLTGRPPFEGSLARVMSQTLHGELPWSKLDGQPKRMIDLLRRMLAKDREARPRSAAALREEIETCWRAIESGDAGGEEPRPDRFSARYQSSDCIRRDSLGEVFRAKDTAQNGVTVALRLVDPRLTAVPTTRRELESQLAVARAHPHPHLQAPLDYDSTAVGLFIVTAWSEGFSLLELLKHRGTLAPAETIDLLAPLANAADHAAQHGIHGLNLAKEQVFIHFPGGLTGEARHRCLSGPLSQWPPREIQAAVLSVDCSNSGQDEGLMSMMTMVPNSSGSRTHAATPALATLVRELLGGRGGDAFAPIARLSEAGNNVLRRALSDGAAFSSAAAFFDALRTAVGKGGSSVPSIRSGTQAAMPVPPQAPSRFKSFALGALVLLLLSGLGAGYYYGIHQPHERDRQKRAEEEAAAEAARQPAASQAPPAGATSGMGLSVQMPVHGAPPISLPPNAVAPQASAAPEVTAPPTAPGVANGYPPVGFVKDPNLVQAPGGNFWVEQWNEAGAGHLTLYQTWMVSPKGDAIQLPDIKLTGDYGGLDSGSIGFPSTFSFSPDGQYLFRSQKIAHGVTGAYLYQHATGLNYQVLVPDLYIQASDFFTQNSKLEWEGGAGITEFSAWEPGDTLVLTLRGLTKGRAFGIMGWRCSFSPSNSQFAVAPEWEDTNKMAIQAQAPFQQNQQPQTTAGAGTPNSFPPIVLPPFSPVQTAPTPPSVTQADPAVQASLQSFFQQIWLHNTNNDPSVWASDFAPKSKYCYKDDGLASRDFVTEDRAKMIDRWPLRRYQLLGTPDIRVKPDGGAAAINYGFSYLYNGAGKVARGISHIYILVEPIDGRWQIIQFNETVNRQ
jgi:serine/threonine protein kinase